MFKGSCKIFLNVFPFKQPMFLFLVNVVVWRCFSHKIQTLNCNFLNLEYSIQWTHIGKRKSWNWNIVFYVDTSWVAKTLEWLLLVSSFWNKMESTGEIVFNLMNVEFILKVLYSVSLVTSFKSSDICSSSISPDRFWLTRICFLVLAFFFAYHRRYFSSVRVYSRKLEHLYDFSEKGQKMAKYLKIRKKMLKIWKYFGKGQVNACDYHTQ